MSLLKRRGFTLIELLTVIAIIGILASIVIVNVSEARKRGRDARRKSDMGTLRSALEMYYEKNLEYPKSNKIPAEQCISSWCVSATDFFDGNTSTPAISQGAYLTIPIPPDAPEWIGGLLTTYLPVIPKDPINKAKAGTPGTPGTYNITKDGNNFYMYRIITGAQGYKLMAKFETDTNSMKSDGGIYDNLYELFTPNARDLANTL